LYNLALSLAQILGMVMLAPLLLKIARPDVLLSLCALLYAGASVALLTIGRMPPKPAPPEVQISERINRSLRQGWRVMVRDRPAFAALVDSVLLGIGLSSLVVIVPQYLERVLSTGADNTVYVFAPAALGLVLGLQIAPTLGALTGHGRLATLGLIGFAFCIIAIGLVGPISNWLSGQAILVNWLDATFGLPQRVSTTMLIALPAGLAMALVNVASRTMLLERVPEDTRARAFATQMLLANLGALLPTLIAGLLIDLVGVEPVAIIFALSLLGGAILARRIGADERRTAPSGA
ncbi:MAG: MFS transporter, partial [Chloroflexota bacterium]